MAVKYLKRQEYTDTLSDELSKKLCISKPVARLLSSRGVNTVEAAEKFLSPDKSDFINPFELYGMNAAVERINKAISLNESVLIYGDYDCDGLTAISILYTFLKDKIDKVSYYVPNRHSDGYGLHDIVVEDLTKNEGIDLVITVDCGITSKNEVKCIKDMGIDVVVTDHHEPIPELIPDGIVLNPKVDRKSFSDYCGAGVVFKLIQAIAGLDEALKYVGIAALGTIADIVPLVGENRIIAKLGLDQMNAGRVLYARRISACLKKETIMSQDIMFKVAPRINALGRLRDATPVVSLFTSDDEKVVDKILETLEEVNKERQILCEKVVADIMQKLKSYDLVENRVIAMYDKSWNIGVLGIAASKLAEVFNRPVMLFTFTEDGLLKGSARSISKINIFDCLSCVKDYVVGFGGHSAAAGVSVTEDGFDIFTSKINEYVKKTYDISCFLPEVLYDLEYDESIDVATVTDVRRLEPFGFMNPEPLFLARNQKYDFSEIGNTEHLKANPKKDVEVVAFSAMKNFKEYKNGLNYILSLENKTFRSKVYTQAVVKSHSVESVEKENPEISAIEYLHLESFLAGKNQKPAYNTSRGNEIFGTLYIAFTYDSYYNFVNTKKGFYLTASGGAFSLNPYNTVVLSPDEKFDFSYYNEIVFLDKPTDEYLSYVNGASKAKIKVSGEAPFGDEIRRFKCRSIDEYRDVYKTLKRLNLLGATSLPTLKYKLYDNKIVSPFKALSTFYIMYELGVIKNAENSGFVFDEKTKVNLENSKIYNFLEKY